MSKIAKKNVGLNVGLNKTEKKVISYLLDDESYSVEDIAKKVDVTKRTIERAFSSLQNKRLIEWIGSKHYGVWHVIK
ncbi:MAG: helix-turn-helix domain-containing protein [Pleomorphochaeta sp.]